jgi:hypothetical protein
MVDIKIIYSLLWVATVLCYLLGDVLRIYAGNFKPGEIGGKLVSHKMYFGIAIIMVIIKSIIYLWKEILPINNCKE